MTKTESKIEIVTRKFSLLISICQGVMANFRIHDWKPVNRKTKVTKSQQRRDDARAKNPKKYNEFYDRNAYLGAIKYAIDKANRNLKDGEKPVPNWFPYGLRHSAGTEITKTEGKDRAQHLLGHASLQTTNIYDDSALEVREELARKRVNPFDV